jgi:phage-related protein
VKPVAIHKAAQRVIRGFSKEVRLELGSALFKLQLGMTLGLPVSRPMPGVAVGAHELRFRDAHGIQRVFYFVNSPKAIVVFHAFTKRTPKTPIDEMSLGSRRLKEMLSDEND